MVNNNLIGQLAQEADAEASKNAQAGAEEVLDFFAELEKPEGSQKYINLVANWNDLEITNARFIMKPNKSGVMQKWFVCDVLSHNGQSLTGKQYSTTSVRVLAGIKEVYQSNAWKSDQVVKIRIHKQGDGFQTTYLVEAHK